LRRGESYVAGGAALNTILHAPRISQDLDLFHDTAAALAATWNADRAALLDAGYEMKVIRERPAFVEAIVRRGAESVILRWTHDSAFRFFPLVEHPELGLTLHPFDLATNKVLALVGATGSISCNATRRSSRSDTSRGRQREKIRGSLPMPFFREPDGRRAIRRSRLPRWRSTGPLLTQQTCPISGMRP
jgi:hypothetical protein